MFCSPISFFGIHTFNSGADELLFGKGAALGPGSDMAVLQICRRKEDTEQAYKRKFESSSGRAEVDGDKTYSEENV